MKIVYVTPQNLEKYRHVMLPFVKRFSTDLESYKWLYHLKRHQLNQRGTNIILALWEGKIIAIYAVSEFGTKYSIFLLSPQYRYPHIGTKLLELMKEELGVSYLKLDITNTDLIKMALNAGYVCFSYISTENGSLKLWFGGGTWDSNDIIEPEVVNE